MGHDRASSTSVRTLVINPRTDSDFVALVEAASPGAPSAEALQALLRAQFPKAIVRPRQLEGEREEVWYVYREGTWIPSR